MHARARTLRFYDVLICYITVSVEFVRGSTHRVAFRNRLGALSVRVWGNPIHQLSIIKTFPPVFSASTYTAAQLPMKNNNDSITHVTIVCNVIRLRFALAEIATGPGRIVSVKSSGAKSRFRFGFHVGNSIRVRVHNRHGRSYYILLKHVRVVCAYGGDLCARICTRYEYLEKTRERTT